MTASIAVVHKSFGNGGAEMTAVHVVDALAARHDVTLVADRDLSRSRISSHFGVDIDDTVRFENYMSESSLRHLQRLTGRGFHRYQTTVLESYLDSADFDLFVSTKNEVKTPHPSLQYVHFPFVLSKHELESTGKTAYDWQEGTILERFHKRLWAHFHFDEGHLERNQVNVLANSNRTKRLISEVYDCDVTVVPPPVNDAFSSIPWDGQESGMVVVPGRITETKRVERALEIAEGVSNSNFHIHIVGRVPDTEYADQIARAVAERNDVHLEGEVTRRELRTLLESHRYGLQIRDENFGLGVAEMILADSIPLVVSCDPLETLVGHDERLVFEDPPEAACKLSAILDDDHLQAELRDHLRSLEKPYTANEFRRRIDALVDELLDE
jgi:hypothetical protein